MVALIVPLYAALFAVLLTLFNATSLPSFGQRVVRAVYMWSAPFV